MPLSDFELTPTQTPSALPKSKAPESPQDADTTGETFLTQKSKHWVPWLAEEAFEGTTIPTFIRKIQGEAHAIKEGDPKLARNEALGVAGTALLNVIPAEKWLGQMGRGALKFLPESAGEAIRSTGAFFNGIKDSAKRIIGEPIGNFVNNYLWNPIRRGGSYIHPTKPNELASFEQQSFANHRQYLDQAYKTMLKDNPEVANELKPLMTSSGNIYSNRVTDPYTSKMEKYPKMLFGEELNKPPSVANKDVSDARTAFLAAKDKLAELKEAEGTPHYKQALSEVKATGKKYRDLNKALKGKGTPKQPTGANLPPSNFPTIPGQKYATQVEWAPHPLTEIPELGPVTDNEQLANLHAESLLQAFRNQMDIKGSTGFASPNEAYEVLTQKLNGMRAIEPSVQNLMRFINAEGEKAGVKNLSDLARLYREEPERIKELPEGLRYYPILFGRIYDMAHEMATKHGFEMGFWDNYVNRLIKSAGGTPADIQGMENIGKRLSTFVSHTKARHWELPLSKLKAIQDGTITDPVQLGLPAGEEGKKELDALREYLFNKTINTNAAESVTAYLDAFARSEMARSVENILHSAQVNPDLEFIKMGMTYPEWQAAKELVTKTATSVFNKEGNGQLYQDLKKMDTLLHTYQPGERYGLPGGNMYHPDAVKAIAPLMKTSNQGTFMNNMLNTIRLLKALKLGGFPGSFFHALNQTQAMMASGQGMDLLFVPKVVKTFSNPKVQQLINKYQAWGLNFARNGQTLQDAAQLANTAMEEVGGPNIKKWVDWLHNNPITRYTFDIQLPADQYLLMNYHLAKAKMNMPNATPEALGHIAAFITNWEMASLRPELMSNMARGVGNYFLLARNFTYRNTGLILNAIHEWFIKTPSAIGILPKEIGGLFKGGVNAIQNMEQLPPEVQDYIRKELADFMGVALAQRMWRLQMMSYMMSGHSTFSNEQGHELDIDTNMAEWKRGPSGKFTYHKIYLNNLGFLHDAFNLAPITPPVDVYNATKNPWVFANPYQYLDLGKTTTTVKNKTNALWTLMFDVMAPHKAGESRLESSSRIAKDIAAQGVPIPIETLMKNWDQITFKHGVDTALEMMAIAMLGQPRVLEGATPNVGKVGSKQQKKGVLEQIKTGIKTP